MSGIPIGTVLRTDLVDSTKLGTRIGFDRLSDVIAAHRDVVYRQIEWHGGRRVSQWLGDGCFAVFDSSREALVAAVAIQQTQRRANDENPHQPPLLVRIGIDTDVVFSDLPDFHSPAMFVADRLQARAEPGTVLVSARSLPTTSVLGIRFSHRERMSLKGFPQPVDVHEIRLVSSMRDFLDDLGDSVGSDDVSEETLSDAVVTALGRLAPTYMTGRRAEELELYLDLMWTLDASGNLMAQLLVLWTDFILRRSHPRAELMRLLEDCRGREDMNGMAMVAWALGQYASAEGDWQEAAEHWAESAALAGRDTFVGVRALGSLASADYFFGHLTAGLTHAREAAVLAEQIRATLPQADAYFFQALMAVNMGDLRLAERSAITSDGLFESHESKSDRYVQPLTIGLRGAIHCLRQEWVPAEEAFTTALALATDLDISWYKVFILAARAELTADVAPIDRVVADSTRALAIASNDNPWPRGWARRALGVGQRLNRELASSEETLRLLVADERAPVERVRSMLCLAQTLLEMGASRREEARSAIEQALHDAEACAAHYWSARGNWLLARCDPERRESLIRKAVTTCQALYGYQDPAFEAFAGQRGRLVVQLGPSARIFIDGYPVHASRSTRQLLATLAASGGDLSREELANLLWGSNVTRAKAAVDRAVRAARQALGDESWRLEVSDSRLILHLERAILIPDSSV